MPHGHWKTTTFVAGLRLSGLAAPFVLDGSINRDAFQTSVERVLVPELAPGDTVVMDNLGSHTGPAGARLLFLPPGSPDFNPIEMAFSKLKALLRKAAERTVEGLWAAIGRLIDTITPDECANFCAAAGYEPDQIENALRNPSPAGTHALDARGHPPASCLSSRCGSACTGARRVPGLPRSDREASNCQGEQSLFIDDARASAINYDEIVAGNAPKNENLWRASRDDWRRGGDSNPRCPCRHAAFRVRCIQPLCHLSARCLDETGGA